MDVKTDKGVDLNSVSLRVGPLGGSEATSNETARNRVNLSDNTVDIDEWIPLSRFKQLNLRPLKAA